MKNTFLKVASDRQFFTKHQRVLVAVSGGQDSMALLELLVQNRLELGIAIGIAHVHHGQRLASDQELDYLKNYAKARQIPFYKTYFQGKFTEEAARNFRYQFFKEVMETGNYTALVTAHHADDQAETVFMRLVRGGRLFDLSAIKECQPFGNGELIRPLLSFRKKDLPDLFHFEDVSNYSDNYFRNRVRHHYLPELRQENPQFDQHLYHLAGDILHLEEALNFLSRDIPFRELDVFKSYPESVQGFLLQNYLKSFPELKIKRVQFQELLTIINNKKNKRFPINNNYELEIDYKNFIIHKINPETDGATNKILLESGNTIDFAGYCFGFDVPLEDTDQMIQLPSKSPVQIRHRQEGDKLLYHGQHKKIRRLFIDRKISLDQREKALVLEQEGKILSLLGIATSDLSKSLKHDTIKGNLYIKRK